MYFMGWTDTWSYFKALGLAKDLGYASKVKMWWKQKGVSFKRGLKVLGNDEDALELANIAESKRCEMEIYLEHGISSPKKTVQVSVPLIADRSETENVQVEATVKDVGLEEMQVGSSQGLGVDGPETILLSSAFGLSYIK
ncbi:hypothetical protein SESBI_15900 [Sesbania bispinosa]|nr:hypothetical protein SESBI_15900 [Sesbania bispinosa]